MNAASLQSTPPDSQPELRGELLYEYTARFTRVVEYGASLEDVLAGAVQLPAAGLRVDIAFAGDVRGKIAGRLEGVDYLNVRADGRLQLDLRGTLTLDDGACIAFPASGVCLPQEGSRPALLRETVRLTTHHSSYAWLNGLEIWAVGQADVSAGTVRLRGYLPV
jgi:hypothetical protein